MRLTPARIFFFINLLFILAIFLLGFRPKAFQAKVTARDLAFYNGRSLRLTGRVCEEADVDYKSRRLTVCVEGKESGQVLVMMNLYPAYDYGDFLTISGELEAPPKIDSFDYAAYLARYDIYSVMYYPKIVLVDAASSSSVPALTWPQMAFRRLLDFKQNLKRIMDFNLPEPEAGLADALLLGYRRTVERGDLDIFARVGLSHMIAISGSHITILSALIIDFFLALGLARRHALRFIFLFLFFYPLITGLAASAVRSAIMGGLAFFAIYHGRSSSLVRALVFSASVMLAFNPRLLRDDIGFQLSFLAIIGIIYIYPLGEELTGRFLARRHLKAKNVGRLKMLFDTVNLTMVSQIIILPVALINFQQLSLIAPLANVLVLWVFAPLLASLLAALPLAALIPDAGVIWFLPSYLLLKFIFLVSGTLAQPAWAAVNITWFNWGWGIIYYLGLWLTVKLFKKLFKI